MIAALSALGDRVVNDEAVAMSPTIGWLLLAAAVLAVALLIAYGDRWRRWWLEAEDPRAIAVFRIVFTFFLIANINGMWEFFEYLYTDEGIFTADVARQVFASQQFAGFGDGLRPDDPWGFYDAAAVWEFLKGPKYSLLFFWDSPAFFWAHLAAFEIAAVCLLIGFRTRLMAVLTWFLMNSILQRNHLAWEGTEIVFRVFLAYLVLARSGHAYSVDNWLRCRKLRRRGLLSERDGPGGGAGVAPSDEHPQGLAAVYRLIPAWPRRLMMLQLAVVYFTTGALKNGSVWMHGDSLYYAMNLDHFYRLPPQYLASLSGTSLLRAMTWTVKFGQMLLPLVLVSIVTRWAAREGFSALKGARMWIARAAFVGLIVVTAAIVWVAWPVHYTPPMSGTAFAASWVAMWLGLWWMWRRLDAKPFHVRSVVIDRLWVCKWIIGRRIFLVWHIAFHAHIFTLMNVGQFQTGMLSVTFAFLEGREIATLLRDIGHRLATWKVPFIPRSVAAGEPILPAEDPRLPHLQRDTFALPGWVAWLSLAAVATAIVMQVRLGASTLDWRVAWLAAVALMIGMTVARRRSTSRTRDDRPPMPWAYGPLGRVLVGAALVFHLAAVATWLLPEKDCVSTFREPARRGFTKWLTLSTTDQGWGMFAPNPPRSNVFMKVLVTDASGEVWDLRTDVYAEEQKPIPWIWNTRLRKMNRRIIGGESGPTDWYRKWYARYECRRWAREHGGEAPVKVELVKVSYSIPTPEQTRKRGYYLPEELLERTGQERVAYTERCATAVMGQLPDFVRERDGLPPLEPGSYKVWHKNKKEKWERRRARNEE
jgi:hypothetical protein